MISSIDKSNFKLLSAISGVSGLIGIFIGYSIKSLLTKKRVYNTLDCCRQENSTCINCNSKETNTELFVDNVEVDKEQLSKDEEYNKVSIDEKTGELKSALTIIETLKKTIS